MKITIAYLEDELEEEWNYMQAFEKWIEFTVFVHFGHLKKKHPYISYT